MSEKIKRREERSTFYVKHSGTKKNDILVSFNFYGEDLGVNPALFSMPDPTTPPSSPSKHQEAMAAHKDPSAGSVNGWSIYKKVE